MQLRMSPGGSILSSLRRRPLDPPSSLTVTTAQSSRMMGKSACAARISAGERTKRFNPLRSVESPVPPPIATTRRPRSRGIFSGYRSSAVLGSITRSSAGGLHRLGFVEIFVGGTEFGAGIRIEQLREARIFCQVLEVRIVARLEAELRFQMQGLVQPLQGILNAPGETVKRGQPIDYVVRFGALLEQLVQMFAGGDVVAQVHQGDCVVEVFFDCLELGSRRAFQVLVAGIEVNAGAVDQFLGGPVYDLLKMRLCLVELVLLHRAQARLITLERLGVTRVLGHGLFRCGFLSHVQNSSCALGNRGLLAMVPGS